MFVYYLIVAHQATAVEKQSAVSSKSQYLIGLLPIIISTLHISRSIHSYFYY